MTEPRFVPHDEVTPGYWYIRTESDPGYAVVKVGHLVKFGPRGEVILGDKWVWDIDEEGGHEIEAYSPQAFIEPVAAPSSL